jgi:hypothetical protein
MKQLWNLYKCILIRIPNELIKLQLFLENIFLAHNTAFSDSHLSSFKVKVKHEAVDV